MSTVSFIKPWLNGRLPVTKGLCFWKKFVTIIEFRYHLFCQSREFCDVFWWNNSHTQGPPKEKVAWLISALFYKCYWPHDADLKYERKWTLVKLTLLRQETHNRIFERAKHIDYYLGLYRGNISSRFSRNSEVKASEFLENLEEMFPTLVSG